MPPAVNPAQTDFAAAARRMRETAEAIACAAQNMQQQAVDDETEAELQGKIDLVAAVSNSLAKCASCVADAQVDADRRYHFNAVYRTVHKLHYAIADIETAVAETGNREFAQPAQWLRSCMDDVHRARRDLKALVQTEPPNV